MTGRVSCAIQSSFTSPVLMAECLLLSPASFAAFPQVILNGELIGGLDIFKDSLESGEWDEMYNSAE